MRHRRFNDVCRDIDFTLPTLELANFSHQVFELRRPLRCVGETLKPHGSSCYVVGALVGHYELACVRVRDPSLELGNELIYTCPQVSRFEYPLNERVDAWFRQFVAHNLCRA